MALSSQQAAAAGRHTGTPLSVNGSGSPRTPLRSESERKEMQYMYTVTTEADRSGRGPSQGGRENRHNTPTRTNAYRRR